MSEINFFSEDIEFNFKEEQKASGWLEFLASHHDKEIGDLTFIFCSDPYLHHMNVEFLQHDTFTDIITFPYDGEEDRLSGDVFISIDRVRDNALKYGVEEHTELIRVMAHGLLHLCGFKDQTVEEKETMRNQEDKAIDYWFNPPES